jgi:alginate O-acetyltransferase complex protein AlgI
MLFNSLHFAAFFAAIYLVYLRLPLRGQNVLLLAGSYYFYASWDWRFLSLIAFSTAVDYICGQRIHGARSAAQRKAYLLVSVVSNLGLLATFKYFNFFADGLHDLLSTFGLSVSPVALNVILPVGISFYTFQTLSYTIDIYRRQLAPERDAVNFALFVAFFPQLVAGPIERAVNLLPQMRNARTVTREDVRIGLWFIYWGFFLKLFVGDAVAPIADAAFAESAQVDAIDVLLGTYAFALQIFGDFALQCVRTQTPR